MTQPWHGGNEKEKRLGLTTGHLETNYSNVFGFFSVFCCDIWFFVVLQRDL